MNRYADTVIRISSGRSEIAIEQSDGGVISRKTITPETLARCFLENRYDDSKHSTGLLPENCVAAIMSDNKMKYFILHSERRTNLSYYGTEYKDFPLPQLVFGIEYLQKECKVTSCSAYVVKDERLTPDTPTYFYPFSNVYPDGHICLGNNALPPYKSPAQLITLGGYILRLPNNNDQFSSKNNRLGLGYRDLLEHLSDKSPEYYYSDILVPNGMKLKDYMK